jgi:cold shock CspA family protein
LLDQARLLRRQTKYHENGSIGTVVRIDPSGEFGFLVTADGQEVYFNCRSVVEGRLDIEVGSRVSYVEAAGDKGSQASTVKVLGKHGLRF